MLPDELWDLQLVVREFHDIPLAGELRAFVYQGQLTALTQYYTNCFFSSLMQHKEQVAQTVQQFFHDQFQPTLSDDCSPPSFSSSASASSSSAIMKSPKLGIGKSASFILDVVVMDVGNEDNDDSNRGVVKIVELNPWGEQTGAGMFDYHHDLSILQSKKSDFN